MAALARSPSRGRGPGSVRGAAGFAGLLLALLVVGMTATAARAQTERLVYASRPGVCGTGDGVVIRAADGTTTHVNGSRSILFSEPWRAGDPPCETGTVLVELEGPQGGRTAARVAVTRPSRTQGSGVVRLEPAAAAGRLLGEARVARPTVARDLIFAATLADAEVWPGVMELARDRSLPEKTRRSALHWLGREAAGAAAPLDAMVRDPTEAGKVREAAVFALSRLPEDRAVPLLIEVARTIDDARVRSRALFWLADFDDPRAIALFEEVLSGPTRRSNP